MISKEKKAAIIEQYGRKAGDTGSPEVQIAILTERITELTDHLQKNPKDVYKRQRKDDLPAPSEISSGRKLLRFSAISPVPL